MPMSPPEMCVGSAAMGASLDINVLLIGNGGCLHLRPSGAQARRV
jgi:hypothetical protein